MNLLFISSRFPYPPTQGDRVRAYNQLKLLSKNHTITLVTPVLNEADGTLDAIRPFCRRIIGIKIQRYRQVLNLLKAPFLPEWPLQTLYFYNNQIGRVVESICRNEKIDLIHVQMLRMAPAVSSINNIPVVIDLIDSLGLNMSRRAQRERFLPLAWVVNLEATRTKQYERKLASTFAHVLVCSALDKEAIGPYTSIHVIRQGVDLARFQFSQIQREQNTIVFSGNMSYFPNADAAEYFITMILPLVRQQIPEIKFKIVGGGSPKSLLALGNTPGVEFIGYTTEVNKYLATASLAIAPMRSGSGMQFKVLEAMACGTPIVVTPYALGGIEVQNGEHLLVGDQPQNFAEQVIALLKNQALYHRLACNARRLVEEKYTWEQSVADLEQVYMLATSKNV